MLTLLETLVAGDSWGKLAVPIIDRYPWSVFLFGGALLSVNFVVFNLITAVMVDSALEARQLSNRDVVQLKKEQSHGRPRYRL
jgi:hypothetical protein